MRFIKYGFSVVKQATLYRFYSYLLGPFWGAVATRNHVNESSRRVRK